MAARGVAPPVVVRPYRPADAERIIVIWLESWRSTDVASDDVTLSELRQRWRREVAGGWQVHVAVAGGEPVGFVAFQRDVLEQLFIAPSWQGRGIGKRLLDLAKERMPDGFRLTTALESWAGRFYEREGLRRSRATRHARFGHRVLHYAW